VSMYILCFTKQKYVFFSDNLQLMINDKTHKPAFLLPVIPQ